MFVYYPSKWICTIITAPFILWMSPLAVLYPIWAIGNLIYSIVNIKRVYKYIPSIILFLFWIGSSTFLSFQIVRFCASTFAEPDSYSWEYAYVSESPNAKCYHKEEDCKYLKSTKYDIVFLSVDEAEDYDLAPCKHCLKNSVKYQYDEFGCILITPVAAVLLWLISKLEKLFKSYTLRSPIIKRNNIQP